MILRALLIVALALPLGGCPGSQPPPTPTVVDTFCLTAKKKGWSIDDTPESIQAAVAWNKAVDRKCGVRRG